MALKLEPISEAKAMSIVFERRLEKLSEAFKEKAKAGKNGKDGKDGVTTLVTKEVLANKEALLDKEEFEKFKEYMVRSEQDIRNSLAQTHNYFGGGGGGLREAITQVTEVEVDTTITSEQLDVTKINVILVKQPSIVVTLPVPTVDKIVIVQQGYSGDATHTIIRENI